MFEPLSKIPGGMRYYFGQEAKLRRATETLVMEIFDGWSYEEITTPSIDYYRLFERGMGERLAGQSFRFTDTDGELLALRPDVTSTIARAAATLFAERARPLRLCYAASVFRQRARSHAEWRRESRQLGCELIGANSSGTADTEMLVIAAEVLQRLHLAEKSCITLNSVEVFNGVAERLQLDATGRERMRQLVDARDAAELERFVYERSGSAEDSRAFARLTQLSGKDEVLAHARGVITNERSVAALNWLESVWRTIERLGLTDLFEIDLGDVSELEYYTGLVCKIYVGGAGARIGSGGRYDGLIVNFGRPEPAIGFVLDLDALIDVLAQSRTLLSRQITNDTTLVASDSDDAAKLFLEARAGRQRGARILLLHSN